MGYVQPGGSVYDAVKSKDDRSMPYSEEETEILAFLRSEQASYYRGDFDAFADHWHHGPEVRRIVSGPQSGTRIHIGWEDLEAKFKEGYRQYPQDYDALKILRWDNVQIQSCGEMAWITYDQTPTEYHPKLHAAPFAHETKIIQKFDGKWKIVCLIVVAPALSNEDVPQIAMDQTGKVVGVNALARKLLTAHQGLTISGNRPRAVIRAYDAGLQKAIDQGIQHLLTNLPRGFLNEQNSAVPLGEDSLGMPMLCWIHNEQERLILSFDDRHKLRGLIEAGAGTFGLSTSQVKLAELISLGHDLASAADELGVSVNTVRTQLRRMFEKTQTHNQAGLISRLLNTQAPA